jgi:hypothetical protein
VLCSLARARARRLIMLQPSRQYASPLLPFASAALLVGEHYGGTEDGGSPVNHRTWRIALQ